MREIVRAVIRMFPRIETREKDQSAYVCKGEAVEFGAAAVRFEGATLGSSFNLNGMSRVLVLFERKTRGRRVAGILVENLVLEVFVDRDPCFMRNSIKC